MKPTAAPRQFPYPTHRTMAQVIRDERWGCYCEMPGTHGHAEDCRVWTKGRAARG